MEIKGQKSQIPDPKRLLAWYDKHRRILPWRSPPGIIPNPYIVWLSEIMLQQTTVATVIPYFQKFIKRWPTINHLAQAPLNDILHMWAGLGYYRRAHFLHACAQKICTDCDGHFPQVEKELLTLPGFGPYTAAAVSAIAFDQSANVVDGNVERVMARLFAVLSPLPVAKKRLRELAADLLPKIRHGDYAQALMDLGATICTPRNPKCDFCPWNGDCKARALGIQGELPQRVKARAKPIRRAIAFILVDKKGRIFLRRRPKNGLLSGMMEVPSSAWQEGPMPQIEKVTKYAPALVQWRLLPGIVTHVFSHFELEIKAVIAEVEEAPKGVWVSPAALESQALPSVMQKILRHALKAL